MSESFVSVQRIGEQLQALHVQEEDALIRIRPGCPPALHAQIVRLVSRIREDEHRLKTAILNAIVEGREYIRWDELRGIVKENSTAGGERDNVVEFSPRKPQTRE